MAYHQCHLEDIYTDSMALAHVNPKMLVWARTRAQITPEQLARNFVDVEKITAWESGDQMPTFNQVDQLAKKFRVPLLVLFLTSPPSDELPLADLRTVKDVGRKKISANFRETINDAIVRQDWYREEFPNAKPRILSKQFSIEDDVVAVGDYLRKTLWINDELVGQCADWNEFLLKLSQNAERAGVLVMRSGVVKNDNRKKLDVDEFRGFALTDEIAPLVFINSNDTTTAQIFTLIHEIVHLCINRSGISNPDPTKAIRGLRNKTELFCNQVTAEVLVPKRKFLVSWQSSLSHAENLKRIVKHFRVSNMVALRRAFDLGKIPSEFFFRSIKTDYARFKKKQEKDEENKSTGGPELFVLFPVRNSRKFTDSVFVALQGGKVAYTEAAKLLGLKVPTLEAFAKRLAA
jgi:Zn-dependent peptidase ImmA (M78 family)